MYTIEDYLKYYGNKDLKELTWNTQDNLFCSILAYLAVESFIEEKNINDFFEYVRYHEEKIIRDYTARNSFEILKKALKCKRYEKLKISNCKSIKDDLTMFGVITLKIENITVVSFKGSDKSAIAWKENLRLGYLYPTYTQKLAIDYFKDISGEKIYVNGHSKGGNLAMICAMECRNEIFEKIVSIDNFDGPGLRLNEFNSEKYNRIISKLKNYLPTNSYVGSMMYNKNYNFIKTNTIGISIHYPFNWSLFGTEFIEGKESSFSNKINNITTVGFKKLNEEMYKDTMETILKELPTDEKGYLTINIKEIKRIINNVKGIDEETKEYIYMIFSTVFSGLLH